MASDHNAAIGEVASSALLPLGLTQKGRSRTWIDDHGWWLIVVEFQPSGYSKGSYLNVGTMHLWPERDHLSFEGNPRVLLGRGQQFVEAPTASDTAAERFRPLADAAAQRMLDLRGAHADGAQALQRLAGSDRAMKRLRPWRPRAARQPPPPKTVWDHFNAAVANGLLGEAVKAVAQFEHILESCDPDIHWHVDLARDLRERWLPAAQVGEHLRELAASCVLESRRRLRLPELDDVTFG